MKSETAIYTAFEDFEGHDRAEPERNLMRAILRGVLDDIRKNGESYRDARVYLLSDDENYLFSFMSVCNHLNLCPRTIRQVCGLIRRSETKSQTAEAGKNADDQIAA